MAIKKMIYTTVQHGARLSLGLSLNEYCVADTIYHLSNNPKNKMQGWCYQSKVNFGKQLGLSKQTIHTIINTLLEKKLITRNDDSRLRTTPKWYFAVVQREVDGQETVIDDQNSYSESSKMITFSSQKSLHNNDINKNNEKSFSVEKLLPSSIKTNRQTLLVLQRFLDIYKVEYRKDPAFGVAEVNCVKLALKKLAVSEALQLVEDWFDSPDVQDQHRPIITFAFSNRNISLWQALYS